MKLIIFENMFEDYVKFGLVLGFICVISIMIFFVVFEDEFIGVVELVLFEGFNDLYKQLFFQFIMNLGVIFNNVCCCLCVEELLCELQVFIEEFQVQFEELQIQQEELCCFNENLEEQIDVFKCFEELLQCQQEEFEYFNIELIVKMCVFEEQVCEVEEKNDEIEKMKMQLE